MSSRSDDVSSERRPATCFQKEHQIRISALNNMSQQDSNSPIQCPISDRLMDQAVAFMTGTEVERHDWLKAADHVTVMFEKSETSPSWAKRWTPNKQNVPNVGIEPTTTRLRVVRSTN